MCPMQKKVRIYFLGNLIHATVKVHLEGNFPPKLFTQFVGRVKILTSRIIKEQKYLKKTLFFYLY